MVSISLIALFLLHLTPNFASKIEANLVGHLLTNHDPLIRPVVLPTSNVTVKIGVELTQIIQVNEKHQIFSAILFLSLTWPDDSLSWNSSHFGNITEIRIPANRIWRPDIYLYNTADENIFKIMESRGSMNAIVNNNGTVLFFPPLILKATCQMDVTWFPFDEQSCDLTFGSWSFSGKQVDLQLLDDEVWSFEYLPHGEWELLGVDSERISTLYECCPNDPYVTIKVGVHIKRKSMYYFINLMVPCALIGFLALLGFTLPPDSGEKLSLGVTVLFSLIVFLNQITNSMPANSNGVPLIGTYFNCVMFTIASSVVSTIVINLNIKSDKEKPRAMGAAMEKILLNWLPWILRMRQGVTLGKHEGVAIFHKSAIEEVLRPVDKTALHTPTQLATEFPQKGDHCENREKWLFAARVVDRLCLAASVVFACTSVAILLISSLT